jgi:hypothetical protein
MKAKFFQISGVQAVLAGLGLTGMVALLVVAGVYFRDEQRIDRWAADNGYDVVSCQSASVNLSNDEASGTGRNIYQVVLKEKSTGLTRTAWFQLGPYLAFKQVWRREDL